MVRTNCINASTVTRRFAKITIRPPDRPPVRSIEAFDLGAFELGWPLFQHRGDRFLVILGGVSECLHSGR